MKGTLRKYFIPHKENNFKPHFIRERSIAVLAFVIILFFLLSLAQYVFITNTNFIASVLPSVLVDLTNRNRQEVDVHVLAMNDLLVEAAQMKANDMASNGYFAHKSPEGLNPWHWFGEAGYDFSYAGENLAINFSDSEEIEKAWMNSPKHAANILSKNFTEIGIATAKGSYNGKETTFVVQMFGKPASQLVLASSESSPGAVKENPETVEIDDMLIAVRSAAVGIEENPEITLKIPSYASWFEKTISSPKSILNYLYVFLGLIILFALILAIFLEIKKQHPRHILYASLLLFLMVALAYINQGLIFPKILIR